MTHSLLTDNGATQQQGRSSIRFAGVLVLVAAAAGGGWWWGQRSNPALAGTAGPASAASAPAGAASGARRFTGNNRVQPVSVATVRTQDVRVLVPAIGNISALNTAVVRVQVSGVLQSVRFQEGQMVKAGQVLAQIDPRSYQIQLAQMQGQLVRDQAQLRNAQLDMERYKDLLAKDSIAKQQVDTQDALVRQLQGTVQTDQAQVDNAKLQLSYTQVTAPISGRLGFRQVDVGNMVQTSDTNGLVSITQTQPLNVVFAVPETHLPVINRRLKAQTPLQVEAWDREQKNLLGEGQVTSTDNAIDTTTGTIKLKAAFANADGKLFPNQFVNVRLQLDLLTGAMVVPSSAIQRGAQGTFVYAVKDDGTVNVRKVRMGTTDGEVVSVQGDVSVGDKVIVDGADRLRDGAKVEVIAAPSANANNDTGRPRRKNASAPADAASASTPNTPAAQTKPAQAATKTEAPTSAAFSAASSAERPRWLDRLPPEEQEKFLKMTPEERKDFIDKARERRRQRESSGG
jgi:multidrug efflux system membrane fusion protein